MARTRNYTFLMYPLDVDNERAELVEYAHSTLHCKIACAVHDKDVLSDGTMKPLHIHVVVSYDGVKSLEQVKEDFATFAANGYIEPVRNLTGALRYLTHEDNPDKYHYSPEALINIGYSARQFEKKEELDAMKEFYEILDWINDEHCFTMCGLVDFARDNNENWLKVLLKPTYCGLIKAYMQSIYWQEHQ